MEEEDVDIDSILSLFFLFLIKELFLHWGKMGILGPLSPGGKWKMDNELFTSEDDDDALALLLSSANIVTYCNFTLFNNIATEINTHTNLYTFGVEG